MTETEPADPSEEKPPEPSKHSARCSICGGSLSESGPCWQCGHHATIVEGGI